MTFSAETRLEIWAQLRAVGRVQSPVGSRYYFRLSKRRPAEKRDANCNRFLNDHQRQWTSGREEEEEAVHSRRARPAKSL